VLSRRWLVNYALILVIAALVYAGIRFDAESGEKSIPRISTMTTDEVERVELRADALQLTLQRDGDGWRITAPVDWPADAANVERLLSILRLESSALAELADVDPRALGLQPPKATLRLNDTTLAFGATNNIGGRRYVLIESRLYLVPDIHLAFAAQGMPGIVDRRLLPGRFDISALRLPELEIRRNSEQQWQSSRGAATTQAQLELLVGNWQALPASRIHRFDAGASPGEPIEAHFTDGQRIDFLLLSTDPEIIIANPRIGLQYHFRASLYDQMIAPAADG
jgi:hypothetical protein